jgi:hypothetical protein
MNRSVRTSTIKVAAGEKRHQRGPARLQRLRRQMDLVPCSALAFLGLVRGHGSWERCRGGGGSEPRIEGSYVTALINHNHKHCLPAKTNALLTVCAPNTDPKAAEIARAKIYFSCRVCRTVGGLMHDHGAAAFLGRGGSPRDAWQEQRARSSPDAEAIRGKGLTEKGGCSG